jgi:hypothetical protein
MKIPKSFIILTSLFIAPIFFGKGVAFSTEVGEHIRENIHQSDHYRIFEAKLTTLQENERIDQPEKVILHVDNYDMNLIPLLQKPFFEIDLAGEEITTEKLQELSPIASQVISLNLMETMLENNFFPLISQLTSLESLILSDNPFDDMAMPFISSLNNLKFLEIVHTKVTGVGFNSLRSLKQLERLNAGCNLLKNIGIQNITQIPSLKHVDVRACSFDATVLPLFFNIPALQTLNISNNPLEKEALKSFLMQAKERNIEVMAEEIK